jgi:mannose-6-phosphate isomerase-like protein (cupin superfamily)
MAEDEVQEVVTGDGYAVANIDALGHGGGFRKIRGALGVTALGINAIVMPAEFAGRRHYHYEQEETYFVHQGHAELEFGDGSVHRLGPGGVARIDAATVRRIRNVGDGDLVYLAVGG